MARKRGGLAGIWDRNKGAIKLLAPMALGMIPGVGVPLAAAAGAAMGGLDRPGKRGIGFDLGGGIRGGLTGAASGMTGAGIKKGVASLFTAKAPPLPALGADIGQSAMQASGDVAASLGAMAPTSMPSLPPMGAPGLSSLGAGMPSPVTSVNPAAVSRGVNTMGGGGSRVGRLLKGAKENWEMVSDVGKGVNAMLGAQGQEAMARQKLEQDRMEYEQRLREFNLKRTETEAERESRRRLTQLLMPFIQAQFSNVLPSQSAPAPAPRAG